MKSVLLFLTLVLGLNLGCKEMPDKLDTDFQLEAPFTLKPGEMIENQSEKLQLYWKEIRDRRCPENTDCKGKGEAALFFALTKEGHSGSLEFKIPGQCYEQNGKCGDTKEWANYIISIIYLNNHPKKENEKPSTSYEVRMKVINKNDIPT